MGVQNAASSSLRAKPITKQTREADLVIAGYAETGACVSLLEPAGHASGGISRSAQGHASGTCTADATYFGHLAGLSAASSSLS